MMAAENAQVLLASQATDVFEGERVEAMRLLREIERLLPEARPIVTGTDFGGAALHKAEQAVQRTRRAIDTRDLDELRQSRDPLERTISLLRSVVGKLKT